MFRNIDNGLRNGYIHHCTILYIMGYIRTLMIGIRERLELAEVGDALAELGDRITSTQRRLSGFVKSINELNASLSDLDERVQAVEAVIQAAIELDGVTTHDSESSESS